MTLAHSSRARAHVCARCGGFGEVPARDMPRQWIPCTACSRGMARLEALVQGRGLLSAEGAALEQREGSNEDAPDNFWPGVLCGALAAGVLSVVAFALHGWLS